MFIIVVDNVCFIVDVEDNKYHYFKNSTGCCKMLLNIVKANNGYYIT